MMTELRCTLYPGQFSSEFAVAIESFSGRTYSLFVPRDIVHWDQEPTEDSPSQGWLRVQVVKREGDNVLILLPQSTIENGPYLSVRHQQLRDVTEPAAT